MKKKPIRYCAVCGAVLSKHNKSGYCNLHRDRTGPNNPFYGKTHSKKTIKQLQDKCKQASLKKWQDPNYAENVKSGLKSEKNLLAHTSEEFRQKQSRNSKKQMQNPDQLQCRSISMKRSWEQGKLDILDHFLPNFSKTEVEFGKLLEEALGDEKDELIHHIKVERFDYPKHYYCPDFKYKNYIIEIDGDYWHARNRSDDEVVHHGLTAKEIRDTDARKTETYEANGFTVIRIWASDFKANPDATIKAVLSKLRGVDEENTMLI